MLQVPSLSRCGFAFTPGNKGVSSFFHHLSMCGRSLRHSSKQNAGQLLPPFSALVSTRHRIFFLSFVYRAIRLLCPVAPASLSVSADRFPYLPGSCPFTLLPQVPLGLPYGTVLVARLPSFLVVSQFLFLTSVPATARAAGAKLGSYGYLPG